MNFPTVLILIPARYQSSRFPGKPLCKIHNMTLIEHVIKGCQEVRTEDVGVFVVTDDDRIETKVKEASANVIRVDENVKTGSERIYLAYKKLIENDEYKVKLEKLKLIINVQGDEPLINGKDLDSLIQFHINSKFDICTFAKKRVNDNLNFKNRNVVKVVMSEKTNKALYFSRSPIPFFNDGDQFVWHSHIGVYSFQPKALEEFFHLKESCLEKSECLEQLRALENDLSIGVSLVENEYCGVDTPEDIKTIEEVISGKIN